MILDSAYLKEVHVMVVGCGALGNEVLKNLVLMGIGRLTLVDFDVVEMGNLSRSILYRHDDVGRPKVEVAREALLDINPELEIHCINGDITHDVGLGTILRMDIVIGCVDSRWARYCIQRLCLRAGKTWVDGGILGLEGTARVFRPGCNCYACSLGEEGLAELRRRMPCSGIIRRQEQAGHAPTTSLIASIIGAVEVQEALRELGNQRTQASGKSRNQKIPESAGRMFYYDGDSMTVRTPVFQAWDDDCPLHEEWQIPDDAPTVALSTTVADILQYGTLILNDPFVDYIIDRKTDERFSMMLPAHRVENAFILNPQLSHRLLSDFYQHEYTEVDETFPYRQLTLSELGIPPEDVLRMRSKEGCKVLRL